MYVQNLTREDFYDHEGTRHAMLSGRSLTGRPAMLTVPAAGLDAYLAGATVQTAFPDLPRNVAEFLISGLLPDEADAFFEEEE